MQEDKEKMTHSLLFPHCPQRVAYRRSHALQTHKDFAQAPPPGDRTYPTTGPHPTLTLYFHLASDLLFVCSRISSLSTSFCVWTVSLLGTLRTLFGVCKQNSDDPKVDRGEWAWVTMAQKPSGSLLLVHTSIHPFLHLPIYLSAHLAFTSHSTIHLPICPSSTCLSIYPPIRLSICPSTAHQLTNPPIHLPTHTYTHPSLPPFLAPEKQHQWNITRHGHGPQDVGEKCIHPGRSSRPIVLNLTVQYDPSVSHLSLSPGAQALITTPSPNPPPSPGVLLKLMPCISLGP